MYSCTIDLRVTLTSFSSNSKSYKFKVNWVFDSQGHGVRKGQEAHLSCTGRKSPKSGSESPNSPQPGIEFKIDPSHINVFLLQVVPVPEQQGLIKQNLNNDQTHLSFQLWQVSNLHELGSPVLVPYRFHLVGPEQNVNHQDAYHVLLQEGTRYGLGQPRDRWHQLLPRVAAVVHQCLTPHTAMLLLQLKLGNLLIPRKYFRL